tara:strand:- start:1092 stop:1616 length:525 start_codon:yes stop_codon:yes gene_type:complete
MEDLKFPIGRFDFKEEYSGEKLVKVLDVIKTSPEEYRKLTANLSAADLNKTYREGSWTVQQLVHHVADMHILHFLRLKSALTDPNYKESTMVKMDGWAATSDATDFPIESSLAILDGIHHRYAKLGSALSEEQYEITYFHPVRNLYYSQRQALALTAWHSEHHLAHIKIALGLL